MFKRRRDDISPVPPSVHSPIVHASKCKDAYESGNNDGRRIAANEVFPNAESDIWIIIATCLCTLCVIVLVFMRKAKISIEQIETVRQEAATLMQIKEKELLTEQTQVRHLQCIHQDYITKCQKQLTLISDLRKKRSSLTQVVSEENGKLHERCKQISMLRREWNQKRRVLRRSKRELSSIKLHLAHTVNLLTAGGLCGSMWLSYNLGYLAA
ncbi:epidermal growth factor receptor substrate 15-like 1-like protein [Perkinsela sp. CCAP 1560/4]|nr:epidermal growth factor receptor substrate 15-like 1-like protein [Perkinsela sp. CCAP 1560/4]|eukprot:KNH09392.1 epidermal growth factor receptor substrate 15-like 1-like protein [Perkinsela sp. CCAP 1560/4]